MIEPTEVYQRIGQVKATQLTEPRDWLAADGTPKRSQAGDWWVTNLDGTNGRGVEDRPFKESHRRIRGDLYRRTGRYRARRLLAPERVISKEDRPTGAEAQPGQWVLTDDQGQRWAVPDDHFRANYRLSMWRRALSWVRRQHRQIRYVVGVLGAILLVGGLSVLLPRTYRLSHLATASTAGVASTSAPNPATKVPPATAALIEQLNQDSRWAIAAVLVGAVISGFLYWRSRRRTGGVAITLVAAIAATVVLIGTAVYAPCAGAAPHWTTSATWVIQLFFGAQEFEGAGAACTRSFSPGLGLARNLALIVPVWGAIGVASVFAGNALARLRIAWAGDVNVVMGLSVASRELVIALLDEHRRRPARARWIDRRPGFARRDPAASWRLLVAGPDARVSAVAFAWWWITGLRPGDTMRLLRRPTRIVVVDPDPNSPYAPELARRGATVLVADVEDRVTLRSVITRRMLTTGFRHRRVTLRKLYAVSPDQDENLKTASAVESILDSCHIMTHRDDVVPRVFVLMDDAREASTWRLEQWQRTRDGDCTGDRAPLVLDAITIDGIAAEAIVDTIIPAAVWDPMDLPCQHVVIAGDGGLSLALLDELAWQLWRRVEFCQPKANTGADDAFSGLGDWIQGRPPTFRFKVTLCGARADERRAEWDLLRAPWTMPGTSQDPMISVEVSEHADVEASVHAALEEEPDAIAVLVEDETTGISSVASRLARRHPRHGDLPRIVLWRQQGPVSEPATKGGLLRVGPRLVVDTDERSAHAPTDSVTRLAAQHHTVYRQRDANGWPHPGHPEAVGRRVIKLAGFPWPGIPDFHQEDNIRQHWQALERIGTAGYRWERVTAGEVARGVLGWGSVLPPGGPIWTTITQAEQARWVSLRERDGWWPTTKAGRNDAARLHPDIHPWTEESAAEHDYALTTILDRLHATGWRPVKSHD